MGQHQREILEVDPDAIPLLRNSFAEALTRVDKQLALAETELRVQAWAQDPVSQDAAVEFNRHSVDPEASALAEIRAYRDELATAVANLDATAADYARLDDDGGAELAGQGNG